MKKSKPFAFLAALVWAAVLACAAMHATSQALAQAAPPKDSDLALLQAELERLKTLLPDQAHAMMDVDYHFTNLWFAAAKQNWPLAQFYLGETKSHLNWAVRLRPIRKTAAGQEIDLKGILQGLEAGPLAELKKTTDTKDTAGFVTAYHQMIEGCYSCHVASEKPYLRTQIPESAATHIIRLDPEPAKQP